MGGWALIHPQTQPGRLTVHNHNAPAGVRLAPAALAGEQLRTWLLGDNDHDVVDLRVMRQVLEMVVSA